MLAALEGSKGVESGEQCRGDQDEQHARQQAGCEGFVQKQGPPGHTAAAGTSTFSSGFTGPKPSSLLGVKRSWANITPAKTPKMGAVLGLGLFGRARTKVVECLVGDKLRVGCYSRFF